MVTRRSEEDASRPGQQTPPTGEVSALTDPARVRAAQRVSREPSSDAVLNRLAELAMALLRTPAAQVSVLTDVQTVTAGAGLAAPTVGEQLPLAEALCTCTAIADGPVAVSDAARDARVADRAPVTSGVVGAYLGVPLTAGGGDVIGALCVFEPVPRQWTDADAALLSQLAELASAGLRAGALATGDDTRRVLWELSVAAAGIGTFDWDLTSGRLSWDDRLIELFGYDRGEGFDETIEGFSARVHPEDIATVTARLQAAIDTGGDYEATYRVVIPSGPTRWVAARGRALRDPAGDTTRVLGAAWDVTASHEAAAEVAAIVEGLAVGFFAVDRDWVLTHVNAATERISGRSREDMLGRTFWDVYPATVGTAFEDNYRHAARTGETVSFDAYYPHPLDVWVEVRAVPGAGGGLNVYFIDITDRRRAQDRAEAAAQRAGLLARITEDLLRSDDPRDAAAVLSDLVVPTLADWAIVTLINDDDAPGRRRGLTTAAASHADPAMQPTVERYAATRMASLRDDAIVVRTLQTATPQFIDDAGTEALRAMLDPGEARDAIASLAPEHVAVYPLTGRNGTVGMLTLCNGAARGPFGDEDRVTASHVAARAGVVLDNARLYRQQRDLAEGLQRSLLTDPPEPDHCQIVVRYTPAAEAAQVGGDWYDAFVQPGGATVLAIGDVVGHDAQAAAAMSQVRTLLRGLGAASDTGPAQLLTTVDEVMETLRVGTTATAVVARLEQTASQGRRGINTLRWSNAGHPPPMVIQPDGAVTPLGVVSSDLLLGVMPTFRRREHEVTVDRGATVLLYTDGLVERRGQSLEVGLTRLQDVLEDLAARELSLDDLCDEVLARMLPARPEDDVALVAVRLHPQNQPRPPEAGPRVLPDNIADEPEVLDQVE